MRKKIIAALLIAVMAVGLPGIQQISASTISDAKKEKDKAQNNLDEVNQSISNIESQQKSLQSEINSIDAELVSLLVDMGVLEEELAAKNEQLIQVKADLEVAQEKEVSQYDAMTKRIQFMYENGDNSFLTAILEADNLADVLNRVHYYAHVYDYDRNLLDELRETKEQIASLKVQVETEKAEMEEMQVAYEEQEDELNRMIDQKKGEMSDFDVKLASAKDLAAQYRSTIEQQNNIIREEEERQRQEAAAAEAARQQEEARRAAAQQAAQQVASGGGSTPADSGGSGGGTPSDSGGSGGGSDSGGGAPSDSGKNPGYSTGVSGSSVVSYACQFIGNPYVWGGNDPNTGADCSGFTCYVFGHFGISLPRTSGAQRSAGQEVSYANAQPGDLICYSGHVAIYMGGGQIVHAANSATGITTGSATYRTILSVRRVL